MTQQSPIEIEQVHGIFYGCTLDQAQCEILAIQNIDRKILAIEPKLYAYKWFDYKELHPTMATYLFAHHYNRAYGDFMGACLDRGKRFMVSFKGKDVMLAREKKSFWKLRQKIDELGIRYDFFCREAMNWCIANGWRQPPRPAHVATNDELIIHVTNLWEMECRGKIQWAISPRYTAAAFVGAPDQLAYEKHLMERIMQRAHPKFSIHAALYLHDALRIEAAIQALPYTAIVEATAIFLRK